MLMHGRILPMDKPILKKIVKSGSRFYHPERLGSGADIRLCADTGHHAIRALRLTLGDSIILFDGFGGEYHASITRIERGAVTVRTGHFVDRSAEAPLKLTLAQGLSSGERMDITIQKAVELGVSAIQPLASERSVMKLSGERATRKTLHWQRLANAACEQCGRNLLAQVSEPLKLNDWMAHLPTAPNPDELRLLLAANADNGLADLPAQVGQIVLLAGPEGGFSPTETDIALRRHFQLIHLGPRILRTETAALAALAAIQLRWGDF